MPVDAKPLFRPDALRPHLRDYHWPDHLPLIRDTLTRWAGLVMGRAAEKLNEQELLADFLTDIFGTVLGYSRPVDNPDRYTFTRELEVFGKFADAALGVFLPTGQQYAVAIEGKGPLDPLDRPFAGRKKSAVDQGYGYAINLPCDWIIVTSMRQTRLYYKGADQYTYERFDTAKLATDDSLLKRFLFLLGAERVTPEVGPNHLHALLTSSEKVGKELTKEFYFRYAEMRQNAFDHLCRENPSVAKGELLSATQKLLDRILFCAFCEDRGLLPADTIRQAYEHRDPYHPKPIWDNFRGLFRAIDKGNTGLNIPAYNGGLFAEDFQLDSLSLTDEVCGHFRELGEYDYRSASHVSPEDETAGQLVDVDILGHIFEQSITDLERLRNELEGKVEPLAKDKLKTRRKKEGAFYTPAFITRYIVEQALGSVLRDRFEQFRAAAHQSAKATAKTALADPTVYDLAKLKETAKKALIAFWEGWQDELKTIRILDPACGSGAFLIEAFDQLHKVYDETNDRLQELRGSRSLFDPDARILQHNLYGVDLNAEAIEICRLSLWIKTAARGKQLTSLDHTIRVGNSVVSDPAVHPRAFDWQAAFPEVFANGGFDVVVGNPPYVRQEWLGPIKPYLQANYRSFHGMADLYVYFYELGCNVLRPGGRLSYVVTNKWMKAGYGEPLRRFFAESAWTESVVDFGHAKQIFEDADVFPSIIVVRKPNKEPKPQTVRVCAIPRETLRVDDLSQQIADEGFDIEASQLGIEGWQIDPIGTQRLFAKISNTGVSLSAFARCKPLTGIKTGFNEAYLIDRNSRNKLVSDDPKCEGLIRPFARGSDIGRWKIESDEYLMIAMKSSNDFAWPWSEFGAEEAERIFSLTFPSLHSHFKFHEKALRGRQDQGRFWWELRSCAYWSRFESKKIFYQLIQFHPCYAFDDNGGLGNNKTAFIECSDHYLLAVLNSPLIWWYNWRFLPHMKDEALAPNPTVLESIPIATPSAKTRKMTDLKAKRLIEITESQQSTCRTLLDWFKVEYGIEKPSQKLQNLIALDSDALVAEIKKLRGKANPLSAAALKALREEDARALAPARLLAAEALTLEHELSDLVNAAYRLTPAEIELMWDTAPPRMPIGRPPSAR